MRYTNAYTDPNPNPHHHSDSTTANAYPHSDSTTTHTYANCNNDPYSAPTDTDAYSHTTDYSLSTAPDGRPHQGSQHAVQFHGTGKPH